MLYDLTSFWVYEERYTWPEWKSIKKGDLVVVVFFFPSIINYFHYSVFLLLLSLIEDEMLAI